MEESKPHLQLETDQPHRLLILHWNGFVPSQLYRDGLMEAVQKSREDYMRSWIMDMKFMKVIRQADQEWTMHEWFPQFQLLGVKRLGFVISEDIFNQMAISSMIATIRPNITSEVEYFQELKTAVKWAQEGESNLVDFGSFSV